MRPVVTPKITFVPKQVRQLQPYGECRFTSSLAPCCCRRPFATSRSFDSFRRRAFPFDTRVALSFSEPFFLSQVFSMTPQKNFPTMSPHPKLPGSRTGLKRRIEALDLLRSGFF